MCLLKPCPSIWHILARVEGTGLEHAPAGDDKPDNGISRHHRRGGRKRLNVRTASSRKLAELYLENGQLKKLGDWLRQRRSLTTSVITAQSLARLPKDSKS